MAEGAAGAGTIPAAGESWTALDFDSVPEAFAVLEVPSRGPATVVAANARMLELVDRPEAQVVGAGVDAVVPPGTAPLVEEALRAQLDALAGRAEVVLDEAEVRVQRLSPIRSEPARFVLGRVDHPPASAPPAVAGTPGGLDLVASGIAVLDADGVVLAANTALARSLARAASGLTGRRLVDLVADRDRSRVGAWLDGLAPETSVLGGGVDVVGVGRAELSGSALPDAAGEARVVVQLHFPVDGPVGRDADAWAALEAALGDALAMAVGAPDHAVSAAVADALAALGPALGGCRLVLTVPDPDVPAAVAWAPPGFLAGHALEVALGGGGALRLEVPAGAGPPPPEVLDLLRVAGEALARALARGATGADA